MKQGYTHIVMVLDRSGSMQSVVADTIGGFNQFLEDQKKTPGEATLTLVQFNSLYEFVHTNKQLADVPPLDRTTFIPMGGTALLDAVGKAIKEAGAFLSGLAEDDRPSQVIFVILTDGEENSSREFTRDNVFAMITHQREVYSWQFVFLGANQDAIQSGASLGIGAGSSMGYAGNSAGTSGALRSMSARTSQYRMSGQQQVESFFDQKDRDEQAALGAKP